MEKEKERMKEKKLQQATRLYKYTLKWNVGRCAVWYYCMNAYIYVLFSCCTHCTNVLQCVCSIQHWFMFDSFLHFYLHSFCRYFFHYEHLFQAYNRLYAYLLCLPICYSQLYIFKLLFIFIFIVHFSQRLNIYFHSHHFVSSFLSLFFFFILHSILDQL